MVNNATNTATGNQLFQDGIESWIMGMPANSAGLAWSASGAEKMRLTSSVLSTDSSINVGIGTTSPSTYSVAPNLVVSTATNGGMTIRTGSSNYGAVFFADGTTGDEQYRGGMQYNHNYLGSTDTLLLVTAGSAKAYLDSSGNLGLGVTPSAWGASSQALQNGGGSFFQYNNDRIFIGQNSYIDSSFNDKFIGNGYATRYRQYAGTHAFYVSTVSNSSGAGASQSLTQAMTLDADGDLGIGTTNPTQRLHIVSSGQPTILIADDAGRQVSIKSPDSSGNPGFVGTTTNHNLLLQAGTSGAGANVMLFNTAGSERARITSGGFFKASNTGSYSSSTNDRYEFTSDKNDLTILVNSTNTGANVNNVYSQLPAGANAGAYHFVGSISGSGLQFTVDADGDVKNTNNSYGSISDIKLKQDVVDAASQWDDIKALRVRKYRFKRNPDAALQIGLVAQEAEAVSPGLVEETADRDEEGNDLGTTTKSVKYSVLYMKAVKALQEAMTRIEQLEAKVAALESK